MAKSDGNALATAQSEEHVAINIAHPVQFLLGDLVHFTLKRITESRSNASVITLLQERIGHLCIQSLLDHWFRSHRSLDRHSQPRLSHVLLRRNMANAANRLSGYSLAGDTRLNASKCFDEVCRLAIVLFENADGHIS